MQYMAANTMSRDDCSTNDNITLFDPIIMKINIFLYADSEDTG